MAERADPWRALGAGATTFVLAAMYLWPLRSYGFQVEDEGTLLSQFDRVSRGEIPYLDFNTGYTPGFFYLTTWLRETAGELSRFRVAIVFVHATAVGVLTAVGARLARPSLAVLAALLYLVFLPIFPGRFVSALIPYPAWFVVLGWSVLALLLLAFHRDRRRRWLVGAGVMTAFAFAMKPNAGVFAIGATLACILREEGRPSANPRLLRACWIGLWGTILLGAWISFGAPPRLVDGFVFLLPLTVALASLPTVKRMRRAGLVGDACSFLVPAAVCTLPWLGWLVSLLGFTGFLREVLLVDSGAAEIFYVGHPMPERWGGLLAVGAVTVGGAGFLTRHAVLPPRIASAGLAFLASLGVVALVLFARAPEGVISSVRWQLEEGAFALAFVTNLVAAFWLWRQRQDAASIVALLSGWMYLLMFPRTDFPHLIAAAPLSLLFAVYLLDQTTKAWSTVTRLAPAVAAAGLAVVVVLGSLPWMSAISSGPRFLLPHEFWSVGVERESAGDLIALSRAADDVKALGTSGFAFPGQEAVLTLGGATNPTPYSYLYPGRPNHLEEAQTLDRLAGAPPDVLIALNRDFFFFERATGYYFLLRRFARQRYELFARHGRYDVLGRRTGSLDATDRALSPAGSEVAAGEWSSRSTPRERILRARSARDGRDVRAAAYLFEAAGSPDPRVADAALEAMAAIDTDLAIGALLWSGPRAIPALPAEERVRGLVVETLQERTSGPIRLAFAARLAGLLGERRALPALRAWFPPPLQFPQDARVTVAAADALARLDPVGMACDVIALLARPEAVVRDHVPPIILAIGTSDSIAREEARWCLLEEIARGRATQEEALWIASVMADPLFAPLMSAVAADSADVASRRAAVWGLGEIPSRGGEGPEVAALTDALVDEDVVLQRLAEEALDKRGGVAPRVFLDAD